MKISIIIPVRNGGAAFRRCLGRVKSANPAADEIIAVDDGSTDDTQHTAKEFGVRIISLPQAGGQGRARNIGSKEATGDVLFFVDADVGIRPDAVGQVRAAFEQFPDAAAVFGSYDDEPSEKNFLSQYKNLIHHYVHQTGNEEAATFWAGCGAMRREAFEKLGGFRENYFPRPDIEDVELGYRLKRAGYRIRVWRALQGKHYKRWGIQSLLYADWYARALPWSEIILREGSMVNDLNLKTASRVSVALSWLLPVALLATLWTVWAWTAVSMIALMLLLVNSDVYGFFLRKRGLLFALGVIPWHWFYFFYSGLAYLLKWLEFTFGRSHSARP